jgi:hypothetical protein
MFFGSLSAFPLAQLCQVTSKAVSVTGGSYNNEYMLTFHLVTDSTGACKISAMKEFVDSKYWTDFLKEEILRRVALHKR